MKPNVLTCCTYGFLEYFHTCCETIVLHKTEDEKKMPPFQMRILVSETRFGSVVLNLQNISSTKTLACDSRSSLILAGCHAGALCGASQPILV